MVEILRSIFLGIIQGLTEFLPVSSSAHLNIFPWLFGWAENSASFDLALHAGTLLAILIYFFTDWIELIVGGFNTVFKKEKSVMGNLFWYIVITTVPAGFIGQFFETMVSKAINGNLNVEMIVISAALIIMGVILFIVDKNAKSTVTLESMTFKQSFAIGFSQMLAGALPGVSRSGITMTVARKIGLDRESAAKYSFFLSAPMVAGAIFITLLEGMFVFNTAFFVGIAASFVSGFAVIKFLMSFLKKGSFKAFAVYRVIFGLFILITAIVRL